MSDKHIKLINATVELFTAMTEDIEAQIKALQAKRREQNKAEARSRLSKVVASKNSTVEELLDACYSFIGTHRLNSGAPRKKAEAPTPVVQ